MAPIAPATESPIIVEELTPLSSPPAALVVVEVAEEDVPVPEPPTVFEMNWVKVTTLPCAFVLVRIIGGCVVVGAGGGVVCPA